MSQWEAVVNESAARKEVHRFPGNTELSFFKNKYSLLVWIQSVRTTPALGGNKGFPNRFRLRFIGVVLPHQKFQIQMKPISQTQENADGSPIYAKEGKRLVLEIGRPAPN
ncbi:hypothetical protein TNIN_458861 [Trichonephila inaurata madagascariensis]|uniref:Uncharacterized protein n=1 Tax=Trichonephila inaurata madagascariensis TaxID=2747483 RepID=A0A8X7BPX8_9ARAC|nr:hypothetical protein TNIN_458861 [Trichonephila inaurata madagascariensis]